MDDLKLKAFQLRPQKRTSAQLDQKKVFNPQYLKCVKNHLLSSTKPADKKNIYSFKIESVQAILEAGKKMPLHANQSKGLAKDNVTRTTSVQNQLAGDDQSSSPDSFTKTCPKKMLLKKVISQRKLFSNPKKAIQKPEPQPDNQQSKVAEKYSITSVTFGEMQQDVEMKVSIKYLRKLGRNRRQIGQQTFISPKQAEKQKRFTLKDLQVRADSVKINEQEKKYIEFTKEYRQYDENMFRQFQLDNNRKRMTSTAALIEDLGLVALQQQSGERMSSTQNNSPDTKESHSDKDKVSSSKYKYSSQSLNVSGTLKDLARKDTGKIDFQLTDLEHSRKQTQEQLEQLGELIEVSRKISFAPEERKDFRKLKLTPLQIVSKQNSPKNTMRMINPINQPQTTKANRKLTNVLGNNSNSNKASLKLVKRNLQQLAEDLDEQNGVQKFIPIRKSVQENPLLLQNELQFDQFRFKKASEYTSAKNRVNISFKQDMATGKAFQLCQNLRRLASNLTYSDLCNQYDQDSFKK